MCVSLFIWGHGMRKRTREMKSLPVAWHHLPLTVTAGDRRVHAGWDLSTIQDHTKPHKIMALLTSAVITGVVLERIEFYMFLGVNFAQRSLQTPALMEFQGKRPGRVPRRTVLHQYTPLQNVTEYLQHLLHLHTLHTKYILNWEPGTWKHFASPVLWAFISFSEH